MTFQLGYYTRINGMKTWHVRREDERGAICKVQDGTFARYGEITWVELHCGTPFITREALSARPGKRCENCRRILVESESAVDRLARVGEEDQA